MVVSFSLVAESRQESEVAFWKKQVLKKCPGSMGKVILSSRNSPRTSTCWDEHKGFNEGMTRVWLGHHQSGEKPESLVDSTT